MGIIEKIKNLASNKDSKKSLLNPRKVEGKSKKKYKALCFHKKLNKQFIFETDKTMPELQALWDKSNDEDLDILEFTDNK